MEVTGFQLDTESSRIVSQIFPQILELLPLMQGAREKQLCQHMVIIMTVTLDPNDKRKHKGV